MSCRRARYAGGAGCTTERQNAHRTERAEEREVLYLWHPWAGCVVRVHEVIEKPAGEVVRCARNASAARWQELPAWMFDRLACLPMRLTSQPCANSGGAAGASHLAGAGRRLWPWRPAIIACSARGRSSTRELRPEAERRSCDAGAAVLRTCRVKPANSICSAHPAPPRIRRCGGCSPRRRVGPRRAS